jgi:hypothetical protein
MSNFLLLEPRCVFIHIPKTGGMTIRKGVFGGRYEGPVFGRIPDEWRPLFKFAFVRNPFDRLVSAWRMFSKGTSDSLALGSEAPRDMTLREFLEVATNERIGFSSRHRNFEEQIRHHAIPQTHPFNCLAEADFVGRFERFEDDFRIVCEKLGMPPAPLPRLNATGQRDYRSFYDAATIRIATDFYAQDLSDLRYEF